MGPLPSSFEPPHVAASSVQSPLGARGSVVSSVLRVQRVATGCSELTSQAFDSALSVWVKGISTVSRRSRNTTRGSRRTMKGGLSDAALRAGTAEFTAALPALTFTE
jgi:hypothetical protein